MKGASEEILGQVEEFLDSKGEFVKVDGVRVWRMHADAEEEEKQGLPEETVYDEETRKEIAALVQRETLDEAVVELARKGELDAIRDRFIVDPYQQFEDARALLQNVPALEADRPRTPDPVAFSKHVLLHEMDGTAVSTKPYEYIADLVESLREPLPDDVHAVLSQSAVWWQANGNADSWKGKVEAFISHVQSSVRNGQQALVPLVCNQSSGVLPFTLVIRKIADQAKELYTVVVCNRNGFAGKYHGAAVHDGEVKVTPFFTLDNVRASRLFHSGLVTMLLQLTLQSRARWNSFKVLYEVVLPFLNDGLPLIAKVPTASTTPLITPSFTSTSWIDPLLLGVHCVAISTQGLQAAAKLMKDVQLTLTESCAKRVVGKSGEALTVVEREWVLHRVARALNDAGQTDRFEEFMQQTVGASEDEAIATVHAPVSKQRALKLDHQQNTTFVDANDASALDAVVGRTKALFDVYATARDLADFPVLVEHLRDALQGLSKASAVVNAVTVFVVEACPSLSDMESDSFTAKEQEGIVATVGQIVQRFATAAMEVREQTEGKEDTGRNAVVSGYLFCLLWAMLTSAKASKCHLASVLQDRGDGFSLRALHGFSFDDSTRLVKCHSAALHQLRVDILAFVAEREGGVFDLMPLMSAKLKESTPFLDLAVAVSGTETERVVAKVDRLVNPTDATFKVFVDVAITAKYLQVPKRQGSKCNTSLTKTSSRSHGICSPTRTRTTR